LRIDAAQKDVEATRSGIAGARAVIDQMSIQLDYTQLKAPGPGIITSRSVEPGEVVTPGREVLALSQLATVDLKIFVDETEIGKVKPGQRRRSASTPSPIKLSRERLRSSPPRGNSRPKSYRRRRSG
jgi:HlyD family secretion protein